PCSSHFVFLDSPSISDLSTLSLHDALPISLLIAGGIGGWGARDFLPALTSSALAVLASSVFDDAIAAHRTFSVETRHPVEVGAKDRKSTRLNSSHVAISYAVFCLKKKNLQE